MHAIYQKPQKDRLFSQFSAAYKQSLELISLLIVLLITTACTSKQVEHGHYFNDVDLANLKGKIAYKTDAIHLLGPPSLEVHHDNQYVYYIFQHLSLPVAKRPQVKEQKVVKMAFNQEEKLVDFVILDSKDIEQLTFDKTRTKVYGDESSFLYEFFGGVGKYNPVSKSRRPPAY